jgi:hypothetical protein
MGIIATRHDWLRELERLSPAIAALALRSKLPNDDYGEASETPNPDALNLASSAEHVKGMADCFELLSGRGVGSQILEKFVTDLTSRNTYGTFSELSFYLWLLENQIPFNPQVAMTGADVLNPNGSDLDGRLTCHRGGGDVYFDVKGFRFREYLIKTLGRRLSRNFPNRFVAIEGNWDSSITDLSDLLGKGYKTLSADLKSHQRARRAGLQFTLRVPAQIQTTVNESDPYELAEINASYAFTYAKQFVRRAPFVLVFVIHPWFSGGWLHTGVGNYVQDFKRAFARRTFLQFRKDATPVFDVTKGAAAGMLSAVGFFDAWRGIRDENKARVALFLNPLATNPIAESTLDKLRRGYGGLHDIDLVRFDHDVY